MRPIEILWLGTFDVNQRLPSRSAQASWTSEPMRDGVPRDQSLPSLTGYFDGRPASSCSGTSYSLNTTRAVSPRRARPQLDLHRALAGSARARQIGREFLLIEVDHAVEPVLAEIDPGHVDVLHQIDDGVPAVLVELVLQRVARRVATRAIVAHELLHARVSRRVVGQRRQDQVAGQLAHQILERAEREILLLVGRRDRPRRAVSKRQAPAPRPGICRPAAAGNNSCRSRR